MVAVERWAPVGFPGYEHYQVSTTGKIRNRWGSQLQPWSKNNKYLCVHLWRENKKRAFRVNRVVASAFLEDWDPELTVDHINHVPNDNVIDNLRMFTQQEQTVHRRPHDTRSWLRLQQYAADGQLVATYESLKAAVEAVGVKSADAIVTCAMGHTPSAHGFTWTTSPHKDLPGEEWKPVSETVRLSNMGRVLRTYKNTPLMCVAVDAKDAYLMDGYPQLQYDGKRCALHIMVAKMFLPPPDDPAKSIVNHKDGNLTNARADNLEWVTPSQNTQHAHDTGLLKIKKAVNQYTMDGTFVATYPSVKDAAQAIGCKRINITMNLTKRAKSAKGFIWTYAAEHDNAT